MIDTESLTAGRELDLIVFTALGKSIIVDNVEHYSTDEGDALRALMTFDDWGISRPYNPDLADNKPHLCVIGLHPPDRPCKIVSAWGATVPLAICAAILKTKEGEQI